MKLIVPVVLEKGFAAKAGLYFKKIFVEGSGKRKGYWRNQRVRAEEVERLRREKKRLSETAAIEAASEYTPDPITVDPSVVSSKEFFEAQHEMEYGMANDPRSRDQKFNELRRRIHGDEYKDVSIDEAIAIATAEAREQMTLMVGGSKGSSGKGWYERVGTHVRASLSAHFPDLADDAEWSGFLGILGVTSAQKSPQNNMVLALRVYSKFKQGAPFAEAVNQSGAMESVKGKLIAIFRDKGKGDFREFGRWLGGESTVGDLRDYTKPIQGVGDSGVGKQKFSRSDMVPNSYLLGPKVGKFYENLAGNFAVATLDRWAIRTVARTMNVVFTGGNADMGEEDRAQAEYFMQQVANNLGLEVSDTQAVLWYYEKRLWEHLGLTKKQDSWDFEQSAENMAALFAQGGNMALTKDEEDEDDDEEPTDTIPF